MRSLLDEYQAALATGDTELASTLKSYMVAGEQQYGTSFQGWTGYGTPNASPGVTPSLNANPSKDNGLGVHKGLFYDYTSLGSNLMGAGGTLLGGLGSIFTGQDPATAAKEAGQAAADVPAAVGTGLKFITDISRVSTTLVGGLLIFGGIMALVFNRETIVQVTKSTLS